MATAPPRTSGLPHLSVEDVWRGALPEGTELVAGSAGVQREAVWCSSLKARAPAFEPLRGGELVLVDTSLLTLARGIRDRGLDVPIIAVTPRLDTAEAVFALRAGAYGHFLPVPWADVFDGDLGDFRDTQFETEEDQEDIDDVPR